MQHAQHLGEDVGDERQANAEDSLKFELESLHHGAVQAQNAVRVVLILRMPPRE